MCSVGDYGARLFEEMKKEHLDAKRRDAFWNICKLRECTCTIKVFVLILPDEGSDNWKEATTVRGVRVCRCRLDVRDGIERNEGSADDTTRARTALGFPIDAFMSGGLGLQGGARMCWGRGRALWSGGRKEGRSSERKT